MPTDHIPIAKPCLLRGKTSNKMACDRGIIGAPMAPWEIRQNTNSSKEEDCPHAIEAAVNPATETSISLRRPNCAAIQPTVGVTIAVATT